MSPSKSKRYSRSRDESTGKVRWNGARDRRRDLGPACQSRTSRTPCPIPFTRYAFLCALEESGSATAKTGWRPLHLLLERDGAPIALLPLYLKTHSYGEYVFDHGWAEAFGRAGGRYYPKFQASIPFTPTTGPRLLVAAGEDEAETARMLLKVAEHAVEEMRASSLHITFMTKQEWDLAGQEGFLRRTDKQFHWENRGYDGFGAFLGDLSSAKRKNLRKERASVAAEGVTFEWLSGGDLTESAWDAFFDCYTTTGNQKWNPPYLTREFFSRVGESMGEQVLLVMAKQSGRYIARRAQFLRRHDAVWTQLGVNRLCAVPAFRGLLLSGDRFRDCARFDAGRSGGARRA